MKPLELTIYPLIENEWTTTNYKGIPVHSRFDGYRTPAGDISEMFIDSHCREKRFADAELAAEYLFVVHGDNTVLEWHRWDGAYRSPQSISGQMFKFATLPDYDDETHCSSNETNC